MEIIFVDFDSLMRANGSTYKLKQAFMGLEELELTKKGKKLVISASSKDWYEDTITTIKVSVSKINKTKVELSKSAKNAKVGKVTLSDEY